MGRTSVVVFVLSYAALAHATPGEQHLSWSTDPSTTVDVTWTDAVSTSSSVSYGPTSTYGSTQTEGSAPFNMPGEASYSHHVRITGLGVGKTYHYAVPSGADHTFTTASSGAGSFSFVAYGDQGTTSTLSTSPGGGCGLPDPGGSPGVPGVPEANATQAAAASASLAVYLGDCAYGNNTSSTPWDAWFTANTPLAADRGWLAAIGNHDFVGSQGPGMIVDGENFFGRFHFPAPFAPTSPWWSTDYEGVHFIFLSGDLYSSSAQTAWLTSDLASTAAKSASWRIVLVHQPAFSSSCFQGDPYEDGVRSTFVPIFDQNGATAHVDLVLQGHRHVYERTYMLKAGPAIDTASYSASTQTYTMPETTGVGTVYVTAGGGGQSLHGWVSTTPPAWSAARKSFYHWIRFSVTQRAIVGEVHDTQASAVFETFTISRDGSSGADAGLDASADASSPPSDAAGNDAQSDAGPGSGSSGGCGCTVVPPTDRADSLAVLGLALLLARRTLPRRPGALRMVAMPLPRR